MGKKPRICSWCEGRIRADARPDAIFCKRKCRQAAWRISRRLRIEAIDAEPKRFAYADPPYPGLAWMYKDQPSYGGEVNHAELIASLEASYDGWALSTGAYALREILPLCPPEARVCPWVKPIGVSGKTFGLHNTWEPLIVVPGRALRPGKRDFLIAQPARGGGDLSSTAAGDVGITTWCWRRVASSWGRRAVHNWAGSEKCTRRRVDRRTTHNTRSWATRRVQLGTTGR